MLVYQSLETIECGRVVEVSLKSKIIYGVVIKEVQKPGFECSDIINVSNLFFSAMQMECARFISLYYCCELGMVYSIFTPQNLQYKDLQSQNIENLNCENLFIIKNTLNPLQSKALDFITTSPRTLLFADTGSGKTEIYIHAIANTIKGGKNAMLLMPEIALTPQIEHRIKEIFGNIVCVWHSRIRNKKKLLESFDKYKIIIGARSALFLPVSNLGLLIIDEEHDDSYKSNSSPRYNARDVSLYLASKFDIKIILGSATPSPNTYYHFSKKDEIFRIHGGYFKAQKNIIFDDSSTILTESMINQLAQNLALGKQVIVFIPIRANFKNLVCTTCGHTIKCKNCSISLSFHSMKNAMICHYCGYSQAQSKICPNCLHGELVGLKIGTQEVARELREYLGDVNIAIFDRDEVSTDSKLRKILNDFNNKKIDILVGTQMISKGHDYHNVALVLVLGIDYLLGSNDYRAYERSVSLLYQISGRCGRRENGLVIVSSKNKTNFERFLGDYEDFLKFELENRNNFYPPFKKIALVIVSNKSDEIAKKHIKECKKIVESYNKIEVVGVSRAPIERLKDKWRYFMMLRSDNSIYMIEALTLLKNMPCEVDVDPLTLL